MTKLNENPTVLVDWFDSFHGANEYEFLSNFYEAPLEWRGEQFPTSEHAFAYAKIDLDHGDAYDWQQAIQTAPGPGAAKSLGRRCPLDPWWEHRKYGVMRSIVWQKFTQNPALEERLLATGDAWLIEGTFWGDQVWGVDRTAATNVWECPGNNWLGHILMETRHRLRIGE